MEGLALMLSLFAIPGIAGAATYQGGGYGTAYTVTIHDHRASFICTGPHESGATLNGARLVSRKGNGETFAHPSPGSSGGRFQGRGTQTSAC